MYPTVTAVLLALSSPSPQPTVAPTVAPTTAPSATPTASPLSNIATTTTAERRQTPLSDSPKPTFIVTRSQIENNGYATIGEALVNVPGVRVLQYGAFGTEADYSAMGALSGGTQVLLNGVPISAGSSGAIDLGTISTLGVDRIEVVESGSSTLYGSGASGGVINIITSVPNEPYADVGIGSFGDQLARLAIGNGIIGGTFERHVATNAYPYASLDGFPGGVRQNAQAMQTDGSLEYHQTLGAYTLRASGRFTQMYIGNPGPLSALTPANSSATNRNDVMAEISRKTGASTTSVTLSGMSQGALYNSGPGAGGAQISSLIDSRIGASVKEVLQEHGLSALVAGIDLSRESALDTLGPFGPPPSFAAAQSQSAAYAQQTIGIGPDGKAYAGIRGEIDAPGGAIALPSAGFLLPVGSARISANAGSAFIVPTLFDLYFPGFSNPNLLPERDRTLDTSLSFPRFVLAPTLTVFDRVANNLITQNASFVPVNAGTAHFQGTTFSLKTPPLAHVLTTFSVTDLWNATTVIGGVTSRADYQPVLSATLGVERPVGPGPLGFGAQFHIQGSHTESYAGPGNFGGYNTTDVYARLRLASHSFLTARLLNVTNEQYGSYYAYPQPGRSYRLEWATR